MDKLHSPKGKENALESMLGYTTQGINALVTRTNRVSFNEVFPRVWTSDLQYLKMVIALSERLPEVAPVTRNADGELVGDGTSTNWSEFRTIMPVLPNPSGTPPSDSTPYAKEMLVKAGTSGLATPALQKERERYISQWTLPDDVQSLIRNFMEVFLTQAPLVSFPIKRTSTMGLPHMTADLIPKAQAIRHWLERGEKYALWMREGNMRALADDGLVFAYFNGYRAQLEGVNVTDGVAKTAKIRQVYDWKGQWSVMDRALPEDERIPKEVTDQLLSARSRQVSASPFKSTLFLRVVARAVEKGIGDEFPFTFKHRDAPDILRKVGTDSRYYKLTDVKSHDQMMHPFFVDAFCDQLSVLFGKTIGDWCRLMFRAPMLVKNDHRGGTGAVMRGNPMILSTFVQNYVNPSGIPVTSNLAKAAGALYMVIAAYFAGHLENSKPAIREFLRGNHPLKLQNLGDNNFLHSNDERYAQFIKDPGAYLPYALLDDADTFAGYTLMRDDRGALVMQRNIATFVKNIVAPDRTMNHPMKGNWAVSLPLKRVLYGDHPAYGRVNKVLEDTVKEFLGTTLDELAAATPRNEEAVRGLNLIDAEFLNNPEGIEYKIDPTMVSPELLEQFYITGTPDDAYRIISHFKNR